MDIDWDDDDDEPDVARHIKSYGRRSIAELARLADEYEFDPSLALRYWVRSAAALERQAKVYDLELAFDEAYILYMRFAQLVLNSFPRHPEAKQAAGRKLYAGLTKDLKSIFVRLQELKPIIEEAVSERTEVLRLQRERQEELALLRASRTYSEQRHLDSEQHRELDVLDLRGLGASENADLLGQTQQGLSVEAPQRQSTADVYPQHVQGSEQKNTAWVAVPTPVSSGAEVDARRSTTASGIEHKAVSWTEGGAPLRTVFVPETLRSRFLAIAQANTDRKVETCGILCGILNRNAFFITHLVIPEQNSTADTCTTTDEEGLFEYLDTHDLFTLGWIHTHPTQTCFLSSVDLHTQNSYQLMLAEAIAIVCAPRHEPAWGVFRLTDPPGIKAVTACRRPEAFHPHEEKNLYTTAQMPPGHVSIRGGLPFEVADLRKGRR
ncbi:uncharacterized protein V1516DRAFT_668704 [Lipomyces oligophaga]|uniref:uncharacterized protein n=1 Tax=Lipomyces oligophaga TaxID=45792 RepID=UPI0034CF9CD5